MTGGPARRSVQILAELRRDIDAFLDPSVLSLALREARQKDTIAAEDAASCGDSKGGGLRPRAVAECHLELLALRSKSEGLQAKLEDAKCEAQAQHAEWERRAGRDAAAIAKLTQERDELEQGGRVKKRRLNEVENKLSRARSEKEAMERECEESVEGYKQELKRLRREGAVEQAQLQAEVSKLKQELSAARAAQAAPSGTASSVGAPAADAEAIRGRVAELEHEAGSLRLALQQARPEGDIGAQLRKRHAEYEEELRSAREVREELQDVRSKLLKAEQEGAALRAALAARDTALREAEEAVHSASLARRDVAAFVAATRTVLEEAAARPGRASEAQHAVATTERAMPQPTPLELSLAWARFQAEARDLRGRVAELQHRQDEQSQQERQVQTELRRVRGDLAAAQARAEELRVAARKAEDECDAQAARVAVLRDAITRGSSEVKEGAEGSQPELEAARKHAAGLEEVVKAKNAALAQLSEELDALRKDISRLSDVDARAARLEQVNSELWSSRGDTDAAIRERGKHITALQEENEVLREELGRVSVGVADASGAGLAAAAELGHRQPTRELERLRRATRKFVREFREGLYGLLGWRVEMRAEGGAMLWHLTSRFSQGRALAFRLRPGEAGRAAQFDLMATPWGEELQGDRKAMAYLEVYGSVPGFLAHVTTGLLRKEAAPC